MKDKLMLGLVGLVAAGITYKAIMTVRYIKTQKELYEEVEDLATDEK